VKAQNFRIIGGILLLLPILTATILNIFYLFVAPRTFTTLPLLAPQLLHPFGTNNEGVDILRLIILGAGHTYFIGMLATFFALSLGLWLGAATLERKRERFILGFVETIETIPVLIFMLVVMAIFNFWEELWKTRRVISFVLPFLRILILSLGIGLAFLPRMIRLVQERIKTFISLDFIDGTKAHGVPHKRILWFHIIGRNCLEDIIVTATQVWSSVVLIEISLDYLIAISPFLGAKVYTSWAGMLLTFDVRNALVNFLPKLNFEHWWLYTFPAFFIISTIIGFYLYGDGLSVYCQEKRRRDKGTWTSVDLVMFDLGQKWRLWKC
jgi:ABC-type dipeptide/oligopeptide/nickel transport system permease subunit